MLSIELVLLINKKYRIESIPFIIIKGHDYLGYDVFMITEKRKEQDDFHNGESVLGFTLDSSKVDYLWKWFLYTRKNN